jgi:hypothetical protein
MKKYIEPKMNIILLQQSNQLLAGSTGVNEQLINTEVPSGWSRELDALNLEGLDLESLNM